MQRKSRSVRFACAAAAIAALSVAACSSGSSSASGSAPSGSSAAGSGQVQDVSLMVYAGGSLSWVGYLAQQQGYFTKNHLNIKFVTLPAGVQATTALAGGSLDVAELDPFNVAPVLTQGVNLQLLVGEQKSYWTLFGQKTSKGQSLANVMGSFDSVGVRSVGGAGGRLGQYLAVSYGKSPTSVQQIADIGSTGFMGGHEPYTIADPGTACELESRGYPTLFSFFNPPAAKASYPVKLQSLIGVEEFGYWATASWAKANPAAVKDLQAALSQTEEWASNPANTQQVTDLLRKSPFNVANVSDSQFKQCVGQTVAELSPTFTQEDANVWSTALKSLGLAPNGLPATSTYFAPGLPQ